MTLKSVKGIFKGRKIKNKIIIGKKVGSVPMSVISLKKKGSMLF